MKTIITYGTFDLFHVGHVNLLKRARSMGDKLIVAVSTDAFNAVKGKTSLIPFEHRFAVVKSCRYVDEVIAEHCWEQKLADIKKYDVHTLVMGDDWKNKFDAHVTDCEVVYLPRTKDISSTSIKNAMDILLQLNQELR